MTVMNGGSVVDGDFEIRPLAPAAAGAMRRLRVILRSHLRIESVWCQAGIRAGVALAAAILAARLGRLEPGFWVVLGTLSALKSSVGGTRQTARQAVVGTLAGFAVSSGFLVAGGENRGLLWAALPLCVFLAVYTPTAVSFMIGQAMFTLT